MPIATGTRLGPYEVLAPIGAGGMGEVYRAKDPRLGRDVAIKVLPASFSSDADRLRRFEQEAKAAGVLNHPNITAVYDIGTNPSDGAPYVVQELLEGETLRQALASGHLSHRTAIDYGTQIAQGLAAAHDKGIVHRDLKPENLFVTRDGRVKILDFGLAKLTQVEQSAGATNLPTVASATEPGVVMGTLGYMSPEQVKGRPADARSDIFSFGAILFEMLSGKRAFHADSAGETMAAILKEDPPDLSVTNENISPGLERIVRHCLEKNPERRFQSSSDIAFALEALSGLSTSGRPAVSSGFSPRPWRAAAAIAGALALAAATYLFGRKSGEQPLPRFTQLTFERGLISSARFAPDARTALYSAAWEGKPIETFSTPLDLPGPRSLGLPSSIVNAVSASGDVLLTLHPAEADPGTFEGTFARAPLTGGSPKEIAADVRGTDCLSDGKTCAIVRLTGGRYRLEFPPGKSIYETAGYISHARLSRDGRRIAFLDHPVRGDDRGFVALAESTGRTRRLTPQWEGSLRGLAWSADEREIWFTASEAGPMLSLHAVDLAGHVRTVYRTAGGVELCDVSLDGRVLLSRVNRRSGIVAYGAEAPQGRELTCRNATELSDISADGRRVLFFDWSESAGPLYETCLQETDGSGLLRLGKGAPGSLSPDAKWVISVLRSSTPELQILPVGPGDPKRLDRGPIEQYQAFSDWLPDGKSILFGANERGHAARLYIQPIERGAPRPITPEGVYIEFPVHPISPDGKSVVVFGKDDLAYVYPIAGGEPRTIPRLTKSEANSILRWTVDGRSVFVKKTGELPPRIWRVDVVSGARELYKEIPSYDPAGLRFIDGFQITPDGNACAYTLSRRLDDLYLVEGLK